MKTNLRKLTLAAACMLLTAFAFAQANNLVVFSQDGYKFTLIVNGLRQNEKPETNVKVTGLTAMNYKVRIIFADANLAPIDQNVYMQYGGEDLHGKELSCSIENTKKGLKLRPNSVAEITTTAAPDQVVYQFNPGGNATQTGGYSTTTTTTTSGTTTTTGGTTETVNVNVGGTPAGSSTTTTVSETPAASSTTTTTTTTTGTTDNVNVNMGVPGAVVGISINVNDGMGGTTTSSTTTTTTSSSTTTTGTTGGTTTTTAPAPASSQCIYPMSSADFANAKKSVSGQSFEEGKLKVAKQVLNSNCMSCAQVKEIMAMFSFEETRLDWAKFAYGKTTDPQNYYQLNDGFSFSSSVDDLNEYIESNKR